MKLLLQNIREIVQVEQEIRKFVPARAMKTLPTIQNGWITVEDGVISGFGTMSEMPDPTGFEVMDLTGQTVLPCWCDSHTHIVYAGSREGEFVDRINGLSYEDIANRGGGILNSARKLQDTSEDELYNSALERLEEVADMGSGAVEIKSGYGLTVEAEMKMLRVIRRLKEVSDVEIRSTFLGAHAVPVEFKGNKAGYVDLIINEMLPQVKSEGLAEYIDIFCEKGYFDNDDTDRILAAGQDLGLAPKVHVNQFNITGGIAVCVNHKALSVDHLEVLGKEDIDVLKNSETMATLLPSCSFFIHIPYSPAREMIDAGLPVALATDYNPGSTPSGNMNFVVSLACIQMNMTPEEAINAATINSAYAMGISETHGSIAKGKVANLIITKDIPSYAYIPYSFGNPVIDKVMLKGKIR